MATKYKPTKPKKAKPAKSEKSAKAAKAASATPMKFGSAKAVKVDKPKKVKESKAPKPEKAKAITLGAPSKVQKTDKPTKMGKPSKSANIFGKIDPKIIIGVAVAVIVVVAVILFTVVLPSVEEHGQQIKHIAISSVPIKMEYYTGEEADYEGLRVMVTKNNGETYTVRSGMCQITGFDSSTPREKQTITVSYEGFSSTFDIVIKERPKPVSVLESIELITMPKTEYKVGEWLDTNGGVILLHYKDGSTYKVSLLNSHIYGFEVVKDPGEYTLTVKYYENGRIAETTYTITVTD